MEAAQLLGFSRCTSKGFRSLCTASFTRRGLMFTEDSDRKSYPSCTDTCAAGFRGQQCEVGLRAHGAQGQQQVWNGLLTDHPGYSRGAPNSLKTSALSLPILLQPSTTYVSGHRRDTKSRDLCSGILGVKMKPNWSQICSSRCNCRSLPSEDRHHC